MILAEHLHHQPQSDESTKNNDQVCLSNNIASWQSTNKNNNISNSINSENKKIEESAVVHRQPDDQKKIAEIDNDVADDDDDDDDDGDDDEDDEDSFTYPSSEDDEENENKQNWVAKRLPEIPQPNVNNQVTGSNRVNISNTNKNVYEGSVVIHQTFYNNLADGTTAKCIDAVPAKKITIDKDTEAAAATDAAAVGPRLSNVSSHPLYPFTQDKVQNWCTKRRLIVISGAVLAGIAIISVIVYLSMPGTKLPTYVPSPPNDTSITNVPTFHDVCIVPRIEWVAEPANEKPKPLAVLPPKLVIIIPVGPSKCFTQAQCAQVIRDLQTYEMKVLKKIDIGYNWLVGGDGLVYYCRGWDVEGEHTKNYDNKSIGIGFIGTDDKDVIPSPAQVQKGEQLIKLGVEQKKISEDYVLVGQNRCIDPSDNSTIPLYNITMQWDHWSTTCP